VLPLKAAGQDAGAAPCEERRPIARQVRVDRFIMEIGGNGAVVSRLCGCFGQCVTPRS
jgi:hypothetical protein